MSSVLFLRRIKFILVCHDIYLPAYEAGGGLADLLLEGQGAGQSAFHSVK